MVEETDARVNLNGLSTSTVHGQGNVNVGLIGLSGDSSSPEKSSGGHGSGRRRADGWKRGGRKEEERKTGVFLSYPSSQKMVASTWTN